MNKYKMRFRAFELLEIHTVSLMLCMMSLVVVSCQINFQGTLVVDGVVYHVHWT